MTANREELVSEAAVLIDAAASRGEDIAFDLEWLLAGLPVAEQKAIVDDAAKLAKAIIADRLSAADSAPQQGGGRPQ